MNEQFKELYNREYGSDNDLDLDSDEDQDNVGNIPPIINQLCKKSKVKGHRKKKKSSPDYIPEKGNNLPAKYHQEIGDESDEESELVNLDTRGKHDDDGLDCESILSRCSNLYNHPKLIVEPRIGRVVVDPKSGIPEVSTKLTHKNLKKLDINDDSHYSQVGELASNLSLMSIRKKDESKEEKNARKKLVREYRRERRIERKLNQSAFKDEKKRQQEEARNVRAGIRLA